MVEPLGLSSVKCGGVAIIMLLVKLFCSQILIAVEYCRPKLADWSGWSASDYFQKMVQPLILMLTGMACIMVGSLVGEFG